MKQNYFKWICLSIGCILSLQTIAQEGTWWGKLELPGNSITLVFHLDTDHSTIDSPDQGVKDVPLKRDEASIPNVSFTVPSIGATFTGVWLGKQITGIFTQHGYKFPLTLIPGRAPVRNRPQTPQPPFPYTCEEVTFTNGDAILKGTLTLPPNCNKNTPVCILITGSGLQNRDEELFGHKPFAVIADAFARNGIASLRYDDRGFGESTGDLILVTTEDLKNDARAGIQFLRERFDKVGVLGHSEGGTIALMLAAEQQADWVISLAGMTISGEATLLAQNRQLLQKNEHTAQVTDAYLKALQTVFNQLIQGEKPVLPDVSALPDELKTNLQQVVKTSDTPYLRYFLKLNIADKLPLIKCPILALNGTKDTQVDYQTNLSVLKKKIQRTLLTAHPCEGLNHLFQHCSTGAVEEYKDIEETFAPEVLQQMIKWIW
ncbi:lipoprotein [gut metagenome]|uniref:Lipoprotein n=1 Tax=gut metagenome TaxID=749906 RepID=J9H4Y8_9ZZZZ